MQEFGLSSDEKKIVAEALESYLSDLRMEITHTDSKDFREDLKHRKTVITKTIHILKGEQIVQS